MRYVRIVGTPPGEAPEHIRRAWIGVEVPIQPDQPSEPVAWVTYGAVTGPRSALGQLWAQLWGRAGATYGYALDTMAAVRALERKDPAAAEWWRRNAAHLLDGQLIFDASVCELLPFGFEPPNDT